jgi:hypothetical protein
MSQEPRLLPRWDSSAGRAEARAREFTIEELTEQVLRLCIGGETTLAQDLQQLGEGLWKTSIEMLHLASCSC